MINAAIFSFSISVWFKLQIGDTNSFSFAFWTWKISSLWKILHKIRYFFSLYYIIIVIIFFIYEAHAFLIVIILSLAGVFSHFFMSLTHFWVLYTSFLFYNWYTEVRSEAWHRMLWQFVYEFIEVGLLLGTHTS